MMNLRFLSLLGLSVLGLGFLFGNALPTQAATVPLGTLVKGSGPAVYYVARLDGRRYVFPDQATYTSWYPDFSTVQTIMDYDLASLQIGGVVTIRPGSRLVKIQTDPRVYAVTLGGKLRWVQTEALARGLFGSDWSRQVSDVSDAFFTSYSTGLIIDDVSDFPEATSQMTAPSLEADLFTRVRLPEIVPLPAPTSTNPIPTSTTPVPTPATSTPVTPTTTPALAGRIDILSTGPYVGGDTVTVLASVTRGYADRATLSFGISGQPSRCANIPCRGEFVLPNVRATSSIPFQVVFSVGEGASLVSATTTQEVTVVPNPISDEIQVAVPVQSIYGSGRRIRVELSPTLEARNIKIVQDELVKQECISTQACEFNEVETARGGASHSVYAIVIDSNFRRLFSSVVTFPVVE